MATLFMGAGMVMLSGLEFLATESGRRLRIMPACGLEAGAGLLCAGVFDRLNINRFNSKNIDSFRWHAFWPARNTLANSL